MPLQPPVFAAFVMLLLVLQVLHRLYLGRAEQQFTYSIWRTNDLAVAGAVIGGRESGSAESRVWAYVQP